MVAFWDTSALIPVFFKEDSSKILSNLFVERVENVIWDLTPIEIFSALCRRQRQKEISTEEFDRAWRAWQLIESKVYQVRSYESVKDRAVRILRIHPLKAADAMQLAAALVSTKEISQGHYFFTLDRSLCEAANKEGFSVIEVGSPSA